MPPCSDIDEFKAALRDSKNIVVIAGQGLSVASGIIPSYRRRHDNSEYTDELDWGRWRNRDMSKLASPAAFKRDPSLVWQFYHHRRDRVLVAKPTLVHYALASFALHHAISPRTFSLITLGPDGLSSKALSELTNTSTLRDFKRPLIFEPFGGIFDVKCTSPRCGYITYNPASPICEALAQAEAEAERDGGNPKPVVPLHDLPRCSKCGALARPGVVWFNERTRHDRMITALIQDADLCIVIDSATMVILPHSFFVQCCSHSSCSS
ncbi:hypothetical protein HGRIS_000920 [Hohenbuehelia grisea]|uniref:Deacetylase sirtuin-type domain-containing protein n=1 Tax=Hohenbuehelia grisea TaxID=104357 RepID=A0ABR3IQ54_9AGAR